jgi:hypothetical protein
MFLFWCTNTIGAGWIGAPIGNTDQALCANNIRWIFFRVRSAIPFGEGCIGAPLVLSDYKQDDCAPCASPIFMLITYYLGFTNKKRKYVEEKATATLISKQTSITTV